MTSVCEQRDKIVAELPRRISDIPFLWAEKTPDAPAAREGDITWSYCDLARAIDTAAAWMRDLGVRPGDRVMIVNENSLALMALFFAVSRLDAWAVVVNARLTIHEIETIRDHCGARRIIYTTAASKNATAHAKAHHAEFLTLEHIGDLAVSALGDVTAEPVYDGAAEQVAVLIYTTGTTGAPKGVMLTHLNMLYVAGSSKAGRGFSPGDRVYGVLPIAHVFGMTSMMLGTLYSGACIELMARFDPAHLAAALKGGITVFQGVPAMYAAVLEYADKTGNEIVAPHLRYLSVGGAPMDMDLKQRVESALGTTLNNGYGLTESAPTIAVTLSDAPRNDQSIGNPLPGIEVRMVDPDGREVTSGEAGEMWVRGPNIMKGYYRNETETSKIIKPGGWLVTGDLARQDADGALFIIGRAKELIIRSGFNVYPPEVEAALNTHPEVTVSAVVGRKIIGNEEVIAFVQLVPGSMADEASIKAHIHDLIAPYKRPGEIIIMEKLPAAPTGKILKNVLADMVNNDQPDARNVSS